MIILTREGKNLKKAHYWKQYGENGRKYKISYKTACDIEDKAVYENRIECYRNLCNNYLCIAFIKE